MANGKNVACIMIYKDHVNLGFFQGAKISRSALKAPARG